jgi:small subunit ribosomal protein S3
MGQKVNPKVFRIGITKTWPSKWFCQGDKFVNNLKQDVLTRKFITREFREAGVDRVEVERSANKIHLFIHTAKPGVVIGRGGAGIEELKKKIHTKFLKNFKLGEINISINEVDRPNLSSQVVAQSMALEIEKRMPFRRVMKQAVSRIERAGALGVRIIMKGRLNGAEIARTEMLTSGKVPLHTLRADIDYCRLAAFTTYGAIGIKVWIYKGEIFEKEKASNRGQVVGKSIK